MLHSNFAGSWRHRERVINHRKQSRKHSNSEEKHRESPASSAVSNSTALGCPGSSPQPSELTEAQELIQIPVTILPHCLVKPRERDCSEKSVRKIQILSQNSMSHFLTFYILHIYFLLNKGNMPCHTRYNKLISIINNLIKIKLVMIN